MVRLLIELGRVPVRELPAAAMRVRVQACMIEQGSMSHALISTPAGEAQATRLTLQIQLH